MGTVVGTVTTPGDDAIVGSAIFYLVGPDGSVLPQAYRTDTDELILGTHVEELVGGTYSVVLPANSLLDVPNTRWLRYFATNRYGQAPAMEKHLLVPTGAGPFAEMDIQDQVPGGEVMSSALAAHIGSASSHGGGKRIAYAELADFVNANTAFQDVPGSALNFEYDGGPLHYIADVNFLKEEAAPNGECKMVISGTGLTGTPVSRNLKVFAGAAGAQFQYFMKEIIPNSFLAGMVIGNTYTCKLQSRTTVATSDFSVLRSFGYNCYVELIRH